MQLESRESVRRLISYTHRKTLTPCGYRGVLMIAMSCS
ncbi:hypothetical protein O9992_06350 [Vibrio lentus]|nr:hypothetical protein [Vibrio lentus]